MDDRDAASTRVLKRRAKEAKAAPRTQEPDTWAELRPALDQELARLPDKYRLLIVLCDLEGKTRKEAAKRLGLAEGTIASRLARGRVMLAKRLSRRGLTLSGGMLGVVMSQNAVSAGMPPSLIVSTVAVAMDQAAVSANVTALTEGVLKTMFLTKLRIATALMLAVALGLATYHGSAAQQVAAQQTEAKKIGSDSEEIGEVRRFEGHTDGIHGVAISSDGRFALSCAAQPGEDDPIVRLWDVKTGKELRRFEGHTGKVEAVAFSPDGKRAASCGGDQTSITLGREAAEEFGVGQTACFSRRQV